MVASRLIQQPNCIKVPKEICINVKANPKKVTLSTTKSTSYHQISSISVVDFSPHPQVKKPVVKEWCYKPSDLKSPSTRLALSQFFSN